MKKVNLTLSVTSVTIVRGNGSDKILIETTAPEGHYPFNKKGAMFSLEAARGQAENYLSENWPELQDVLKVVKTRE